MKNYNEDAQNWEQLHAGITVPKIRLKKLTIVDWLHQDLLFKAGLQVETDLAVRPALQLSIEEETLS
jgi:hypothetical protein